LPRPGCLPACLPAALNLSGGDPEAMKKVETRINAVLAEKAALEQKLARMEASYKGEIDSLKVGRGAVVGGCVVGRQLGRWAGP